MLAVPLKTSSREGTDLQTHPLVSAESLLAFNRCMCLDSLSKSSLKIPSDETFSPRFGTTLQVEIPEHTLLM
jgi:hypothetical protein